MAKRYVQYGAGLPVDPRLPAKPNPPQTYQKALPREQPNDPGQYVEFTVEDFFTFSGIPLPPRNDIRAPDGMLAFVSNKQYNCLEIGYTCLPDTGGFVVPDLLTLALPQLDKTDIAGTIIDILEYPYMIRYGNVDAVAIARYDELRPYVTAQHAPRKTYISPVVGSEANSQTNEARVCFRMYGTKLFNLAFLTQWNEYRNGLRNVPEKSPHYTFKFWYDARETVLRTM